MAKFTFIVRPVTVNFDTVTLGQDKDARVRSTIKSVEWGGIEVTPELSVQEMAQLALSQDKEIRNLREFLRSELPDVIRNVGKAVLEIKEAAELQQLKQDERQFNQNKKLFGDTEKTVHRITRHWLDRKD